MAIAPGRAIGALTTPGCDTEAARYVARLLGVRQVVLGVMLWQARNDRAWLRRVEPLSGRATIYEDGTNGSYPSPRGPGLHVRDPRSEARIESLPPSGGPRKLEQRRVLPSGPLCSGKERVRSWKRDLAMR